MRFGRSTCRVAPTKKSRKKEPMIGCVFGSSGPERYSAPAGRRVSVSTVPGMKWKKNESE